MNINDEIKAAIDFIGSYVKKFDIEISKPPSDRKELKADMKIDYSLGDLTRTGDYILGALELRINTELFNEEGSIAVCKLRYLGLFRTGKNTPEETFKHMLELNGVMILYQLSRSLIISITAQAGLFPPLTLPLINIHKVIEKKKGANLPEKPDTSSDPRK